MKIVRLSGSTIFVLGVCQDMVLAVLGDGFRLRRAVVKTDPIKDTARFAVQVKFLIRSRRLMFTDLKRINLVATFGMWGNNGDIDGVDDWQLLSDTNKPITLSVRGLYSDGNTRKFVLKKDQRISLINEPLDLSPLFID